MEFEGVGNMKHVLFQDEFIFVAHVQLLKHVFRPTHDASTNGRCWSDHSSTVPIDDHTAKHILKELMRVLIPLSYSQTSLDSSSAKRLSVAISWSVCLSDPI